MRDPAAELAGWASRLIPLPDDLGVARRALADTLAVTVAAFGEPVAARTAGLSEAARWAAVGHALDFDDVHLPSTSHVSVVCVCATLAAGGDARDYLGGAGVMARLGTALGWDHYRRGWHATCTAGAPAAAVSAGLALGLDEEGLARALALAVPAAGGVQRAFGTDLKPLQVGFAVDAGVRAAKLAAAGATADPASFGQWLALMGGAGPLDLGGPAIPGGLAVKLYPCCYAMQRPIGVAQLLDVDARHVTRLRVEAPASSLQPLIHDRPETGPQAKFSLPYAIATALIDRSPGLASFTDPAVARPEVRDLMERVEVFPGPGGDGVFAGRTRLTAHLRDGSTITRSLDLAPGHPDTPPSDDELAVKIRDCAGEHRAAKIASADWKTAASFLRTALTTADTATPE
ncbi:MmgE/PrpD family protein [Actinomadura madurae]|uniref:MmgE/PrpD family protein n=1 Tax=Actinomadura madurae TaxID=1993 RepID=UPI0020D22CA1|nr:MmgE/PrpD family protein [Actinomadura madurae]MCP9955724.1 MmgE/PrpD family protein [Actinomadura madurae]